jgi:UDP-N-acetylmuramyl pentapeptide phosphotransferase/UDP-N-acetylglucosamine-1-phosphate transferase
MWSYILRHQPELSAIVVFSLVSYGVLSAKYKPLPRFTRFLMLVICVLVGCILGFVFNGFKID